MASSRVTATQADATQLKVDASSVAVPVTDNGGSLTVDGAVTVSGTATVSGTVTATGPLTDTQLRATAVPVSGTVTANAGTNLNTSALALDATQATTNTEIGIVTETAPASDTASSGLNGRLQRIAQRLTSLIAVFTIGAGTEAAAVRVTLPTDGTGKVSAAQSGTWTVQPGNTANTTAWKVDGSAVTQPVSLAANQSVNVAQINGVTPLMGNGASGTGAQRVTLANDSTGVIATVAAVTAITNALPAGANAIGKLAANSGVDIGDVDVTSSALPTGASTAAKQPALGTAGTASADVITVQGVASGTPLTVGGKTVRVSQTPTVSTSPAYTAKDSVGGLLTFANVARVSGGSGVLQSVTVIDLSQQRPSLELVLFDRTFTNSTDNAVFDPTDGDLANSLGVVAVNSWSDFNDNSVATVDGIGKAVVLSGTSLFGQLMTRGTPTFVGTSDIIVIVTFIQD